MSAAVERILDAVRALDAGERAELEVALRRLEPPVYPPKPDSARVDSLCGSLAHIPGSVDEFLRRKREDLELE